MRWTVRKAVVRAGRELDFIRKKNIRCLTFIDEDYPSRLRECDDAPIVLFFKGNADLNSLHILNMVGTRHATGYGTQLCASFRINSRLFVRMYWSSAASPMALISMPTVKHWPMTFLQ